MAVIIYEDDGSRRRAAIEIGAYFRGIYYLKASLMTDAFLFGMPMLSHRLMMVFMLLVGHDCRRRRFSIRLSSSPNACSLWPHISGILPICRQACRRRCAGDISFRRSSRRLPPSHLPTRGRRLQGRALASYRARFIDDMLYFSRSV